MKQPFRNRSTLKPFNEIHFLEEVLLFTAWVQKADFSKNTDKKMADFLFKNTDICF